MSFEFPIVGTPKLNPSIMGTKSQFPYLAMLLKDLSPTDYMSQGLVTALGMVYERYGPDYAELFVDRDRWAQKIEEVDLALEDNLVGAGLLRQYPELTKAIDRRFMPNHEAQNGFILGWIACGDMFAEARIDPNSEPVVKAASGSLLDLMAEAEEEGSVEGFDQEDLVEDMLGETNTTPPIKDASQRTMGSMREEIVEDMFRDSVRTVLALDGLKDLLTALSEVPGVTESAIRLLSYGGALAVVVKFSESPSVDEIWAIQTLIRGSVTPAEILIRGSSSGVELQATLPG